MDNSRKVSAIGAPVRNGFSYVGTCPIPFFPVKKGPDTLVVTRQWVRGAPLVSDHPPASNVRNPSPKQRDIVAYWVLFVQRIAPWRTYGLWIADFGLRISDASDILDSMDADEFKRRTKAFALRVIRLVDSLPTSRRADVFARQLLRAGTAVGANYRAACRARSAAEFVAKMGVVEEECDESLYWMELLIEAGIVQEERLSDLMTEADAILAMVVTSIRAARPRR